MLASTCHPIHSPLSAGVLAFSQPPSFNSANKDESQWRSSSSFVVDTIREQHVCSLLFRPCGVMKRPRDLIATGGASMACPQSRLSCLRGGSAAEDTPHAAGDSGEDGDHSDDAPPTAAYLESGGSNSNGSGTSTDKGNDKRQQPSTSRQSPAAFQPPGVSSTSRGEAFGVALVTERSTATGGSRGRVSYSVLADGTLQIGRPRQQRRRQPPKTGDLVRERAGS